MVRDFFSKLLSSEISSFVRISSRRATNAARPRLFAAVHEPGSGASASAYRSGRSPDWLKMKNPACSAAKREAEEDWGRWLLPQARSVRPHIKLRHCTHRPSQAR